MEEGVEYNEREERVTLAAAGDVVPDSTRPAGGLQASPRFEVLAITQGVGNGWVFSEKVLQESVDLWNGTECFVDHGPSGHGASGHGGLFEARSVRDLGGVFHKARWSGEKRGVMVDLETTGPSGPLVAELGRQLLEEQAPRPKVGFSADVLFTAKGREVTKILRVLSLDLVFNPARGGAFVRALNQAGNLPQPNLPLPLPKGKGEELQEGSLAAAPNTGGSRMTGSEKTPVTGGAAPVTGLEQQMSEDLAAVHSLLAVQQERERVSAEAEKARELRAQMCGYLLESGLGASKLPAAMQEHVRQRFSGRVFEPAELTEAIDAARKLVSDLQGPGIVAGPSGRIHSMFNTEDQLQAAVDDMLGAPREPGAQSLKTSRLSGIKELYMMLTGDRELYGGYYADRVQLATTANFTGLVKNALNKVVANQWDELGAAGYNWWERIVTIEHFETLNQITGILVGTVGTLPAIVEGAEYTELKIGDSPEVADFTKYGGYVPLTLELIDRDDTRKLRQYPRELAKAGLRRVSSLVSNVFTSNAGVGPTMADTGALFNNTAVTTAGGHANLLVAALSSANWEIVKQAMYVQPLLIANEVGYMGLGPAMAVKPRYLLVPIELELTAMQILYPQWMNSANIHSENMQRQALGDVVVVPEWTDATDWAAVADPRLVPSIVVGERFGIRPEIFIAGDELSPAVFTNDEHRIKVRHFLAVLVQDFRGLHKSNVAGV